MSYLVDDNGGFNRFTRGPGIYVITFAPGDRDLKYVGASKAVRTRLKTHLKGGAAAPAWAGRLATRLYYEEFEIDGWDGDWGRRLMFEIWNTKEYRELLDYTRRNSDAEVVEEFHARCPPAQIGAAEDKWIDALKPCLNSPRRSKGGYKVHK